MSEILIKVENNRAATQSTSDVSTKIKVKSLEEATAYMQFLSELEFAEDTRVSISDGKNLFYDEIFKAK